MIKLLEMHLPRMTDGRRWEMVYADDFSAHRATNVKKTAW